MLAFNSPEDFDTLLTSQQLDRISAIAARHLPPTVRLCKNSSKLFITRLMPS